jgi:hypothetical protein
MSVRAQRIQSQIGSRVQDMSAGQLAGSSRHQASNAATNSFSLVATVNRSEYSA